MKHLGTTHSPEERVGFGGVRHAGDPEERGDDGFFEILEKQQELENPTRALFISVSSIRYASSFTSRAIVRRAVRGEFIPGYVKFARGALRP